MYISNTKSNIRNYSPDANISKKKGDDGHKNKQISIPSILLKANILELPLSLNLSISLNQIN